MFIENKAERALETLMEEIGLPEERGDLYYRSIRETACSVVDDPGSIPKQKCLMSWMNEHASTAEAFRGNPGKVKEVAVKILKLTAEMRGVQNFDAAPFERLWDFNKACSGTVGSAGSGFSGAGHESGYDSPRPGGLRAWLCTRPW